MTLKEKLNEDLKVALKAQNKELLGVIRMLLSSVQYGKTAAKPVSELDSVLGYRKQLLDSLEIYPTTSEKHAQIKQELAIVENYVPKAPSEEELKNIIKDKISQSPEKLNAGLLMKELKQLYPTCDGKSLMALIQKELN